MSIELPVKIEEKLAYNAHDITGEHFGRLTAIAPTTERKNNRVIWYCGCECGGAKLSSVNRLRRGYAKSCGCLRDGETTMGEYSAIHIDNYNEDEQTILQPMVSSPPYIREHRAVVALYLGRALDEKEHVHHVNGDTTDNRIENLEVWNNGGHPSGVRLEDKSKAANDVISDAISFIESTKHRQGVPREELNDLAESVSIYKRFVNG